MAKYPKNPKRFSQTYTDQEVGIYIPMEMKLMEVLGKNRKGVHLEALRHLNNSIYINHPTPVCNEAN